jgi:mono/diheme cytochrome c family protein
MFESRTIAALGAGAGAALMFALSGCSSDEPGTTTSPLSQAYQNNCARCHGATGLGTAQYPKLPGTRTTVAEYTAAVRTGNSAKGMSAFSASQISDADLKADFEYMTTKR